MENQNFEDSQSKVKHEVPVEFVLILPRPTIGWPAIKHEKDVKPKLVPSVKLIKLDAKWKIRPQLFQTFFTCPPCQLVVKNRGNLTRHLRTCSKVNPARFECDFCGKRFQKKWRMVQHMLNHSSEKKFCCTKCGVGFKTKWRLQYHERSKKTSTCAVCEIRFTCKPLLNRHRSDIHGNVYKCDKCSYQTKIKFDFMNHKRSHKKSVACETCQRKFSLNQHLKLHQMQHKHGIYATAPEQTFDCDKCGESFSSPNYLKQHQRVVHDENEVKCEVCGKILKNRILFRQHGQIHKKVECSICHKMISKRTMSSHLRSHSAENHFKCDLCHHSTKTKGKLKSHIERMHLLKKLLNDSKCRDDFCDFELLEKLQLQLQHESSATSGEKKLKCDKCGKCFAHPNSLNGHKRRVHTDKLFECSICEKSFKEKSYLNRHKATVHA